jgi:putative hydrolase of the HAD superfamily
MAPPEHPDLTHVDTWIFDLDNTLYAASSGIFAQIDHRMTEFIAVKYKLARDAAGEMRLRYYRSHGTTLSGLMEKEGQDPHEFLSYVHDIDLSMIDEHIELRAALSRLPGRRIVYTNGSRAHAERVTAKLGIGHLFDAVYDIAASDYLPKPHRAAYEAFLDAHDIAPQSSAMFEDMVRNLEVPHALGMTTVLVTEAPDNSAAPAYVHYVARDLAEFLNGARIGSGHQE